MIKRLLTISLAAAGFVVVPTSMAYAGSGYNPPPAVEGNCNAGHGTFGELGSHDSNLGINDPGSNEAPGAANPHAPAPGGTTTGSANSGYSASCRTGG
jgi:hypothetical protein